MLFTSYCQMRRISLQATRKIHIRYATHFWAILSNYDGVTAYICRRFTPTSLCDPWLTRAIPERQYKANILYFTVTFYLQMTLEANIHTCIKVCNFVRFSSKLSQN